ncbi:MAG: hypothetical protein HYU25_01145 [Candidatus Rokubacteria bacterium]|nr:hypothetical protein [Candidatus Rokubacteria bacterium]
MTGRLLVAGVLVAATAAHAQMAGVWERGLTGRGTPRWAERDGKLIYRGGAAFAWAVLRDAAVRDGHVQVRLRSIGGREDRAGGVIWRWRDAKNYYVARANALAGNVVAFKVVNGRRVDLTPVDGPAGRARARVASAAWHTLRVDFAGEEFRVTLDGRRLFTVRDGALAAPGAVGVWSKADSITEFQKFEYAAK